MTRKVVNDAAAYLQSLAELRGRNIEWAEETVREGANLRASAALEKNVIDLIAPSLDALLQALDGWEVELGSQLRRLRTAGARLVPVETDWRHELLSIITDPAIAYGLLIIGMYGLILEFYNPGTFLPAVTGIICLLVGAYGLHMLPINYAGLALIIVGLGLIMAEVMTPTYGVLGVGGIAAFVIGSIMLVDSDLPGYQVPLGIIAGFAAATGGIALFVVGAAVRARRRKVVVGAEAMIGGRSLGAGGFPGAGNRAGLRRDLAGAQRGASGEGRPGAGGRRGRAGAGRGTLPAGPLNWRHSSRRPEQWKSSPQSFWARSSPCWPARCASCANTNGPWCSCWAGSTGSRGRGWSSSFR